VPQEVINNPITLQSTVNGALITVQKNSIAHAELAQGENGMLVKGYNPNNRTKAFGVGVGFNTDGTIKGREHLIPQRTPGNDVKTISPAQAAMRLRGDSTQDGPVEVDTASELAISEANEATARAQMAEAEANQRTVAAEAEAAEMRKQLRDLKAEQGSKTQQVKKR
jgi:hypothetical protein